MPYLLGVDRKTFTNSSLQTLTLNSNNLPFRHNDVVQAGLFDGCHHLKHLELVRNDLSDVSDERFVQLFGDLENLQYLDLSSTQLDQISPRTFEKLPALTDLLLSYNKLTELPDFAFDVLRHVTTLSLNGNSISVVRETTFGRTSRDRLTRLDLSGNPFVCSCDLMWFQRWLLSDARLFSSSSSAYMCQDKVNTTVQSFHLAQQSCLLSRTASLYTSVTVGLLISTLTLLSLLYRYRWHIRLVLYEAFRGRGDRWRRLQEQHFQYDVFVSYDNEDVGWVLGNLIPRLEGDLGLELCVHQRDFIPGQNIVDNIVHCVQNSKKVMMLFSANFAKSHWCQFELNLCLNHVMENDDMLLVVMLEDIPSRDLTPAMMAVMKTTTYIEWFDHDDARASFWGRLLIALTEIVTSE
nr:hypothetical protein BaRGS_024138 [Batillaria attramentaria]